MVKEQNSFVKKYARSYNLKAQIGEDSAFYFFASYIIAHEINKITCGNEEKKIIFFSIRKKIDCSYIILIVKLSF